MLVGKNHLEKRKKGFFFKIRKKISKKGGGGIVGLTSTNQAGTKIGEKFSGKRGFGGKAAGGVT